MLPEIIRERLHQVAAGSNLIVPEVKGMVGERLSGLKNGEYYVSVDSADLAEDGQDPVAHEVTHVLTLHNNPAYRNLRRIFQDEYSQFVGQFNQNKLELSHLQRAITMLFTQGIYEEMTAIFFGLKFGKQGSYDANYSLEHFNKIWHYSTEAYCDVITKIAKTATFSPQTITFILTPIIRNFVGNTHMYGRMVGAALAEWLYQAQVDGHRLLLIKPEKIACICSELFHRQTSIEDIPTFLGQKILKLEVSEPTPISTAEIIL